MVLSPHSTPTQQYAKEWTTAKEGTDQSTIESRHIHTALLQRAQLLQSSKVCHPSWGELFHEGAAFKSSLLL